MMFEFIPKRFALFFLLASVLLPHCFSADVCVDTEAAESIISRFLSANSSNKNKFHVQGWRWHTMSVIREAERLQKLALQQQQQQQQSDATTDVTRLQQAADYVVDFNLKALHRVEKMFFPKMRQWMKDSASGGADSEEASSPGAEIIQAFDKVISDLEQDQKKMAELGKKITHSLSSSSNNSNVARTVADQSGELVSLAKSMLHREIHLIMPTVARCVPEREQKKFNNQVIKFLGVLESRVHLVHMHEVVEETKSKLEQQLWEESIPSLPRSMIPRWKRTLYEPKAGALVMP